MRHSADLRGVLTDGHAARILRGMDASAFNQTVTAVLFGNFLTFLIVFSLWRIGRYPSEMKGYLMFLACCGVGLLFVYASAT
jgi:hypothetical protein